MGMIWTGYRLDAAEASSVVKDDARFAELLESDDERVLDLDKSWHGIHWLLTGNNGPVTAPLSSVIFGGEPCGDDQGYGPPRLLEAAGVTDAARALRAVDDATLRDRVDPVAMSAAELYPFIWDEEDIFEEYLQPNLAALRSFYDEAAGAHQAVIQLLS